MYVLGGYVATELRGELGRYIATEPYIDSVVTDFEPNIDDQRQTLIDAHPVPSIDSETAQNPDRFPAS
ncbi:hypothetical protein F2Q70_00036687 [Brassica cretica]|uniref:Uncharacterized protein n=1 Tax=Brassica cretica TaxID=69181 RepID=A0A8S9JTQ4_BRACR|nr:hypothetical protein F2Q70_00036687 [Brassica cretica]KAF3527471.1 hypothetical protein DY000_02041863 [Brassica cretica]